MKRKTDPGIKILTFVVPACAPNIPSRPHVWKLSLGPETARRSVLQCACCLDREEARLG